MTQIAYSELTKRFYYLPIKGSKVDITSDIKEIVSAHTKEMFNLLKESRDAFVLLSLVDKSKLSKEMIEKIEKITHQK
jgi:hypothetical protein